ncbi:Nif3-like dinuclear metal center hexameric protein [Craterilacuibacter sp. RT1T]|uniref:Nif3-like dinuclear metal center hexameric protein n=1 Tax=Craterilacuibacter sp. RT1T TaxID=2942211 RepID=UPI0020BF4A7B|nr:Nif3-like dinuclear metal center hexameric protein [Craterilacuibacter sp. RT1T]MCL6263648.1 Nif3-like dinuclear metal center hexameric protein [Craterilacuibacter sp. RT1T]
MQLTELIRTLDSWLEPWRFKDYAPNGLQVEGRAEVKRVVCGVTASQALIDAAIERKADAVLVHHGYFWKNEDSRITGIKRARIASLLAHDISLIAYHLPLDGHAELGNNAQLGARLGCVADGQGGEQNLLWHGHLPEAQSAANFAKSISAALGREAVLLGDEGAMIKRVAWCSGGAQGMFGDAIALGVDAFVTGEVSEQNTHQARESKVAFIAAGHHASERYGIQALGDHLSAMTGLEVEYVEISNPI